MALQPPRAQTRVWRRQTKLFLCAFLLWNRGVGWHLGIGTALALDTFKWLEKLSTDKLYV